MDVNAKAVKIARADNEKGNTRQQSAPYEVKDAVRRRVDPLVGPRVT